MAPSWALPCFISVVSDISFGLCISSLLISIDFLHQVRLERTIFSPSLHLVVQQAFFGAISLVSESII
jgi:hypothetical protein